MEKLLEELEARWKQVSGYEDEEHGWEPPEA